MNEKIIKPGVVKRIVDSLRRKEKKYTQEDVETKYMAERKSRNIVENKEMILPEHYRVYFKAGSKLNQAAKDFTQKKLGGQAKNG